jgi:hypothetical protein
MKIKRNTTKVETVQKNGEAVNRIKNGEAVKQKGV